MNIVSAQKQLATNGNFPIVTPQYTDEFVKQSNEITEMQMIDWSQHYNHSIITVPIPSDTSD